MHLPSSLQALQLDGASDPLGFKIGLDQRYRERQARFNDQTREQDKINIDAGVPDALRNSIMRIPHRELAPQWNAYNEALKEHEERNTAQGMKTRFNWSQWGTPDTNLMNDPDWHAQLQRANLPSLLPSLAGLQTQVKKR